MYTVYLRRTEEEYWKASPRKIVAMITEWKKIEHERAKMDAYYHAMAAAGQEIPDFPTRHKPIMINPFYL